MINSFMNHEMKPSMSKNPASARLKPSTVLLYNVKMGGVDDVDKITKPNETIRKTLKWYVKVFHHLWDLTVYNSFVAYKLLHPNTKRRMKDFIEALLEEILIKYPAPASLKGRKSQTPRPEEVRLIGQHFPKQSLKANGKPRKSKCWYCTKYLNQTKTTSFRCDNSACTKWLCIRGTESCFQRFHRVSKLKKHSNHRFGTPPSTPATSTPEMFEDCSLLQNLNVTAAAVTVSQSTEASFSSSISLGQAFSISLL